MRIDTTTMYIQDMQKLIDYAKKKGFSDKSFIHIVPAYGEEKKMVNTKGRVHRIKIKSNEEIDDMDNSNIPMSIWVFSTREGLTVPMALYEDLHHDLWDEDFHKKIQTGSFEREKWNMDVPDCYDWKDKEFLEYMKKGK